MTRTFLVAAALAIPACSSPQISDHGRFFQTLLEVCERGEAYSGQLTSTDEADADFADETLIAHFRSCSSEEIRIPFHVGADRSRTWVITPTESGLRLKHDHRHEDGTEDVITQYGGDTVIAGSATRQEFPVDAYSIDLFKREGLSASVTNVWAVEVDAAGALFAYELSRENRFFRVQFDLGAPVELPPAPWGAE